MPNLHGPRLPFCCRSSSTYPKHECPTLIGRFLKPGDCEEWDVGTRKSLNRVAREKIIQSEHVASFLPVRKLVPTLSTLRLATAWHVAGTPAHTSGCTGNTAGPTKRPFASPRVLRLAPHFRCVPLRHLCSSQFCAAGLAACLVVCETHCL